MTSVVDSELSWDARQEATDTKIETKAETMLLAAAKWTHLQYTVRLHIMHHSHTYHRLD